MDGRCSTCKHWKPTKEYEMGHSLLTKNLGYCGNTPMFWEATEWAEDGDGRCLKKEFVDTKAFVQDGSDYSATLITAREFGCVSYSPGDPGGS